MTGFINVQNKHINNVLLFHTLAQNNQTHVYLNKYISGGDESMGFMRESFIFTLDELKNLKIYVNNHILNEVMDYQTTTMYCKNIYIYDD